ncbi:MAG: hypothetical protein GYB30_05675 [Gammaproteobacteria bacterium]|nr:hypothetical protein [Gammaproteobacteria bacterium]
MNQKKELVIFVPGFSEKEPQNYLDKLVTGLNDYCNSIGCSFKQVSDSSSDERESKRQLLFEQDGNESKVVDIHEVYWADTVERLSTARARTKAIRGLSLIWFWLCSRSVWSALKESKFLYSTMIGSIVLMVAWYIGILLAVLTALSTTPNEAFTIGNLELAPFIKSLGSSVSEYLGGWYLFGLMAVIVSIFPIDKVVDASYLSQCYLVNRSNLFHKVRGRINSALNNAIRDSSYEKYTIVGYSFGAVIAVEALASYAGGKRIEFISLGSPLLLISAKSRRVFDAVEAVKNNSHLITWSDFYSDQDWLCTRSPGNSTSDHFISKKISVSVPLDEKMSGMSHELYFGNWEVLKTIFENNSVRS